MSEVVDAPAVPDLPAVLPAPAVPPMPAVPPVPAAPGPPAEVARTIRRTVRRRGRWIGAALTVAVAGLMLVNVLLGSFTVTIPDFLRLLSGVDIPGATFIVLEVKLPRALLGAMIGVALGLSGAMFQTMLRNPLASPDIIGISYGASAAAVVAIIFFRASGPAVPVTALAGALLVAVCIYLLSRRHSVAGYRLILVGVGFAAVLQAVIGYLLTRMSIRTASEALVWLTGSLNSGNWDRVRVLGLALLVLVPIALRLGTDLRGLELGDDAARGLGLRVDRVKLGVIVTAVALAALATAAAGPVAFIAFLSGPIARRLLRGRPSLPVAALVGAVIVLASDFVAANLLAGVNLPVGVVTGALGAPFLLWLLVVANRTGQGG